MKKYIKINIYALLVFLLCVGCSNDNSLSNSLNTTEHDYVTISLPVYLPQFKTSTRGLTDQDEFDLGDKVQFLIYGADEEECYEVIEKTVSGVDTNNNLYNFELKVSRDYESFRLAVLANYEEETNDPLQFSITTERANNSTATLTRIPLWGWYNEVIDINDQTTKVKLTSPIDMKRAVSKVEFINRDDSFDFKGVYVVDYNTKGLIPYVFNNAEKLNLPSDIGFTEGLGNKLYFEAEEQTKGAKQIQNMIYLPETSFEKYPVFIIKGSYKNNPESYYKVELIKKDVENKQDNFQIYNLKRNYNYSIVINKVNNSGWSNIDNAYANKLGNVIEYDILDWESAHDGITSMWEHNGLFFGVQKEVRIPSDVPFHYIPLKTNIGFEDLKKIKYTVNNEEVKFISIIENSNNKYLQIEVNKLENYSGKVELSISHPSYGFMQKVLIIETISETAPYTIDNLEVKGFYVINESIKDDKKNYIEATLIGPWFIKEMDISITSENNTMNLLGLDDIKFEKKISFDRGLAKVNIPISGTPIKQGHFSLDLKFNNGDVFTIPIRIGTKVVVEYKKSSEEQSKIPMFSPFDENIKSLTTITSSYGAVEIDMMEDGEACVILPDKVNEDGFYLYSSFYKKGISLPYPQFRLVAVTSWKKIAEDKSIVFNMEQINNLPVYVGTDKDRLDENLKLTSYNLLEETNTSIYNAVSGDGAQFTIKNNLGYLSLNEVYDMELTLVLDNLNYHSDNGSSKDDEKGGGQGYFAHEVYISEFKLSEIIDNCKLDFKNQLNQLEVRRIFGISITAIPVYALNQGDRSNRLKIVTDKIEKNDIKKRAEYDGESIGLYNYIGFSMSQLSEFLKSLTTHTYATIIIPNKYMENNVSSLRANRSFKSKCRFDPLGVPYEKYTTFTLQELLEGKFFLHDSFL